VPVDKHDKAYSLTNTKDPKVSSTVINLAFIQKEIDSNSTLRTAVLADVSVSLLSYSNLNLDK
jgi:hypothetical protein